MYTQYSRPKLGELFETLNIDKMYHKGMGNDLFYFDESNEEIKVRDFIGGYGANLFGHNHPELIHVFRNLFEQNAPFNSQASNRLSAGRLAKKLSDALSKSTGESYTTYFGNTGAEAVEIAIKHASISRNSRLDKIVDKVDKALNIAKTEKHFNLSSLNTDSTTVIDLGRRLSSEIKNLKKRPPLFIGLKGAFHGKTTGALNLTFNSEYRVPFSMQGVNSRFINVNSIIELSELINKYSISYSLPFWNEGKLTVKEMKFCNVAGVFIEPIQGEAGVIPIPFKFIREVREACDQNDIHLIFDEIQTGMGRTGTFTYSEKSGVAADYYLFSKSLGGGVSKVSSVSINNACLEEAFDLIHSSTFSEDCYSSSVALKAIELLESEGYKQIESSSKYLFEGLEKLQSSYPEIIKDVRGSGLMLGLEFFEPRNSILKGLSGQNKLGYILMGFMLNEFDIRIAPTLSNNLTLRLEPSYLVDKEACDELFYALDKMCNVLQHEDCYYLMRFIINESKIDDPNSWTYHQPRSTELSNNGDDNHTKVAFIGHLINKSHLNILEPSFSRFSTHQKETFVNKVSPILEIMVSQKLTVVSETNDKVSLYFLALIADANDIMEEINSASTKISDKILDAVSLAQDLGCHAMGFGGYTSIMMKNCLNLPTRRINYTTGNSLTVAMGLQAIYQTVDENNLNFEELSFAVIGAKGNIGSTYSKMAISKFRKFILIGKEGHHSSLKSLAADMYELAYHAKDTDRNFGLSAEIRNNHSLLTSIKNLKPKYIGKYIFEYFELQQSSPIRLTTDLNALREAKVILCSSSHTGALIYPEILGEGKKIICDLSVPSNLDESLRNENKDLIIIQGGIVDIANNKNFKINGIPLEDGQSFACISETLLLGLEDYNGHFSIGKVKPCQVNTIKKISDKHGFKLARPKFEASY
ncbi:MAG: hypothetical protein C9356_15595 [Oleiphilus sp.]|nr:MAG: hypothetical protein C9356_15595 [Oleiphilus sp.]